MTFSLRHTPALDGLRGCAILCVLAGHLGWPVFGGSVIMFPLSGFLITSILLKHRQKAGSIKLSSFYAKRFLRLIPALVVMLILINIIAALARPAEASGLQSDTLYSLLYAANWSHVWGTAQTLYLAHLWSLSVEEQFYLMWPLVLIIVREARSLVLVCACIAVMSWAVRVNALAAYGQGIAYLSTFARLDGLMLGAALAALLATPAYESLVRLTQQYRQLWRVCVFSACFVLIVCLHVFGGYMPQTLVVGMTIVSLCAVLIILACVLPQQTAIAHILSHPVLTHIGKISYGIYLWHYPLILLMEENRIAAAALSILAGQISFYLIEQPVMHRQMSLHVRTNVL